MKRPFLIITAIAALCANSIADTPVPAKVLVATEEMKAKDFTVWTETDLSKYEGAFTGDVGGDSTGLFTIKIGKAKKGEFPILASGSFTLTPAGQKPTIVKFENATYYGDAKGVFTVGAFNIVFVNYGKTPGVIVGNVFLPKE